MKRKAKGVRFAEAVDEVHLFDTRDAPSANIFDVVATSPQQQHHVHRSSSTVEEVTLLSSNAPPPTPQKWSVHQLDGQVRAEFDTEDMTVAELRAALTLRNLSTKGRKAELKRRLEDDLTKGQRSSSRSPSPHKKKRTTTVADAVSAPDWLQW